MSRDIEALLAQLVNSATPVRRLLPPWRRAGLYLGYAAGVLLVLALLRGVRGDLAVQLDSPVFLAGVAGGLATGLAGTVAALMLAAPDRSRAWLAVPLGAAAVWLGAVGVGCLRAWVPIAPGAVTPDELASCFATVVLAGTPMTLGLVWLLRRAVPLRAAAPLAAAALAASGLTSVALSLLHSIEPSVMILGWNGLIVALALLANAIAATRVAPCVGAA